MPVPPLPHDEAERLRALISLQLLDTPAEERFDRITRLAQRMFGVTTCLVSLVDARRQWFKSKQGLDACETDRDVSFCGHAILNEAVFVVPDASKDERFADNPLVTGGPKIRFYAGCPVRGPFGQRIGTLCLIDPTPRDMTEEDCDALRDIAAMVEDEFRLTAQSTVDELTGVANRRGFRAVAGHMLALCRRTNTRAHLMYFDLDGFKSVNDTFGHAAGDALLEHFARLLGRCFRSADVIARQGGDEFVVLLTATGADCDVAETRLARLAADTDCEVRSRLAWSSGCIAYDPQKHSNVDDLLREADEKMYRAKHKRRAASG